jgi:hypothetical protein
MMRVRAFDRFRLIAPGTERLVVALTVFLLFEALQRYLERRWPIGIHAAFRPSAVILFIFAVQYGISRVTALHPVFQAGYLAWLNTTPWTSRKPLPLGPVHLVWEDALILGPLALLSARLPEPRPTAVLCAFLLCYLGTLVVSFWLTRTWAIGYLSAFGEGLAVWFWNQPILCFAIAALVYLIAHEGLRRALDQFPWTERASAVPKLLATANSGNVSEFAAMARQLDPCGWPYDRMLWEIVSDDGIWRIDAVLASALVSWWLYVLASYLPDPRLREGVPLVALCILTALFVIGRLGIYAHGYDDTLTFWARIRLLRWIIPRYDQIFVGPLCTLVAGPMTVAFLHGCGCPLYVSLPIACAMVMIVAMTTPPRLKRWRLTGQHRIVPRFVGSDKEFMKLG